MRQRSIDAEAGPSTSRRWIRWHRQRARRSVVEPSHVWYLQAELEQGRHLITTADTSLSFAVIGAGRLGASFALALRAKGASLVGFTAGSPAGRARAERWLGGHACEGLATLVPLSPQLFIIAVPDQELPIVAAGLGQQLTATAPARGTAALYPPIVVHTSGATSVKVLDPCLKAGATVLAFHPLQTFTDPTTGSSRFAGAAVAITPSASQPDRTAGDFGFALARLLGARPFLLPDHKRSLYHAAASFACNYLVTLEHQAEALFVESGLPREHALALFLPLVAATLENVATLGTVRALTGPLSRGDSDTIRRHLDALRRDAPHLVATYRELGLATLELVRLRDEVDPAVIDGLHSLLSAPAASRTRTGRPET